MKTIAVLTSGGDAPGMNAAVRAVVRTACENGIKVYGVIRGYNGLINGDLIEMDLRSVSDIITRGGTILYSARSFRGARDLSERGIPCVGLPGTIDNDIACCDCTIGYDTCLNTIMSMVDRIRDTTESHDRCSVVEVMGRRAGYLALNSGIACGATSILIPEVEFDIEKNIIERMKKTQQTGKHHFVIIVAEGVDVDVKELAAQIEAETGVESRWTILGHTQRGGSPTVKDRVMATRMGNYAVKLLMQDIGNRVVASHKEDIVDYDIFEALNMKKSIDMNLYNIAHEVSI